MHECYAMQIQEKKKKGMVTKNRAIKHKDHENQR